MQNKGLRISFRVCGCPSRSLKQIIICGLKKKQKTKPNPFPSSWGRGWGVIQREGCERQMLICKLNMSLEANLKPPFLPAPHWPAACLWNKSTEEVRKQTAVESILQPCLSLAEGVPTASQLLPSLEWTSKRSEMTITLLRGLSVMGACGARGSTKLGDWIVLIIKGGVSRNK